MISKLSILMVLVLATFCVNCSTNDSTTANANDVNNEASTKPAPDNSEVTTSVDANGVRTETRVFRNDPRLARVVVTTKDGKRTVKAYSVSGEEREINNDNDENVLEATGSKIAQAAGFVASKTEDAAGAVKDKAAPVGDKVVDGAKTVGSKTAEGAKTVGEKTAEGAKVVGEKTAEGATAIGEKTVSGAKTVGHKTVQGVKKVGSAVKKIIPD